MSSSVCISALCSLDTSRGVVVCLHLGALLPRHATRCRRLSLFRRSAPSTRRAAHTLQVEKELEAQIDEEADQWKATGPATRGKAVKVDTEEGRALEEDFKREMANPYITDEHRAKLQRKMIKKRLALIDDLKVREREKREIALEPRPDATARRIRRRRRIPLRHHFTRGTTVWCRRARAWGFIATTTSRRARATRGAPRSRGAC